MQPTAEREITLDKYLIIFDTIFKQVLLFVYKLCKLPSKQKWQLQPENQQISLLPSQIIPFSILIIAYICSAFDGAVVEVAGKTFQGRIVVGLVFV